MRNRVLGVVTIGLVVAAAWQAAAKVPASIAAAVNDPGRPDADKQRDAERKPAALLAFAGVKPGTKIVDLIPGGGYFTRIFAKAVGDKGYVYAYIPSELDGVIVKMHKVDKSSDPTKAPTEKAKFDINDVDEMFSDYPNVSVVHAPINNFVVPESVDIVWTSDNYHDLHDPFFAPADLGVIDKAVFTALKPGGVFVVVDHAAPDGSGLADTNTLHRIDEAVVKKEVEAAGFKLVAESSILRNKADDRTTRVFDPSIRGRTDQFVLKFRKP